jgi:hypothetical protein
MTAVLAIRQLFNIASNIQVKEPSQGIRAQRIDFINPSALAAFWTVWRIFWHICCIYFATDCQAPRSPRRSERHCGLV